MQIPTTALLNKVGGGIPKEKVFNFVRKKENKNNREDNAKK